MGKHIEHLEVALAWGRKSRAERDPVGERARRQQSLRVWIPSYLRREPTGEVTRVEAHWREMYSTTPGDVSEIVDPQERAAYEANAAGLPPPPPPVEYPVQAAKYAPGVRKLADVVVKTLPRMTASVARRRLIDGMATKGYTPTNITRTTTGKTIITFVRPD